MVFQYKSCPQLFDLMIDVGSDAQPQLKRSLILRYDRSHAGASARDDAQSSAVVPKVTGEADMEGTGPRSVGGGDPLRPANRFPTHDVSSKHPIADELANEAERDEEHPSVKGTDRDSRLRAERLAQIQAEIAAGTYDTPEKLEVAVERMLRGIR